MVYNYTEPSIQFLMIPLAKGVHQNVIKSCERRKSLCAACISPNSLLSAFAFVLLSYQPCVCFVFLSALVFVFVFCKPLCLSFLSPVFVFFSAILFVFVSSSAADLVPQKKENSLLDKEKTIQCLRRLKSQLNSIQLTMKEKRLNYKPLKDSCGTCKCGLEGVLWRHVSECLLFLVQIMGSHNPRGTQV